MCCAVKIGDDDDDSPVMELWAKLRKDGTHRVVGGLFSILQMTVWLRD